MSNLKNHSHFKKILLNVKANLNFPVGQTFWFFVL